MRFGTYYFLQAPPSVGHPDVIRREIEQMVWTEELGFDSVWLTEHHYADYGLSSAPSVLLSTLAARTERVKLGMAVYVLPFHHPIRLAEETAMIDILSNGRLTVGIGRGNRPLEFSGHGVSLADSRSRTEEGVDVMLQAWTQDRVNYEGKHWHFDNIPVYPKPLTQPHPPIAVAATSEESVRWTAKMGFRLLNSGLTTLQFQSLSVSPHDVDELQGGTQDNGTWENYGSKTEWRNTMIGDGGQSGFDVAVPEFRFHNFTGVSTDVNFNNGNLADWIWISDPVGAAEFYAPVISDPSVSGTLFAGTNLTAYRTKTFGLGSMTLAQANQHCNEWTGDFTVQCGDWAPLGPTPLTSAAWGTRAGGTMSSVERTAADTNTGWAATSTGRIFVSKNVDANPVGAVGWTRIDTATTPNRYPSSIYVDANNGNHAWVSYSGFDANTPATPGHLFEVTYNPGSGTATWVDRSNNWGDLPASDVALDEVTGNVYASSDFGVLMLPSGSSSWELAAPGMPNVEVTGLTMVSGKRVLYAASHGLGAWRLKLG